MSWQMFFIKFDPVIKICDYHGCLYQYAKKEPAWSADIADKSEVSPPVREKCD